MSAVSTLASAQDILRPAIQSLFAQLLLAGFSRAQVVDLIVQFTTGDFISRALEDPDQSQVNLRRELMGSTAMPTEQVTELQRCFDTARTHEKFRTDLKQGTLSVSHLAAVGKVIHRRIDKGASTEALSAVLDECYADVREANDLALHNQTVLSANQVHKAVQEVVQRPQHAEILKQPDTPSTPSIHRRENGTAILIRGIGGFADDILARGQSLASRYIPLLDETGQKLAHHIDTAGLTTLPQEDPAALKRIVPTPKDANDTRTIDYVDELYSGGAALAITHSTMIGLSHLGHLNPAPITIRTADRTQPVRGHGAAFAVTIDVATGQPIDGGVELNTALGRPLLVPDLGGNLSLDPQALQRAASMDYGIHLRLINSTPPQDSSAYPFSQRVLRWLMQRNGGCMYPGCGATTQLEGDHINPMCPELSSTHAQSSVDNGQLLCVHHHREKTQGLIQCWTDDGGLTVTWRDRQGNVRRSLSRGVLAPLLRKQWEKDHGVIHPAWDLNHGCDLPRTLSEDEAIQTLITHWVDFLNSHRLSSGVGDVTAGNFIGGFVNGKCSITFCEHSAEDEPPF